jgi:hypothetical protein
MCIVCACPRAEIAALGHDTSCPGVALMSVGLLRYKYRHK